MFVQIIIMQLIVTRENCLWVIITQQKFVLKMNIKHFILMKQENKEKRLRLLLQQMKSEIRIELN